MAVLGSCFVIDLMRETKRGVVGPARLKLEELHERGERLRIAIVTLAELQVGVAKSVRPEREKQRVDEAIEQFAILNILKTTAEIYGAVVGGLEQAGLVIDAMDGLIGSVALEYRDFVVSHNVKHFARIPGLVVEDY